MTMISRTNPAEPPPTQMKPPNMGESKIGIGSLVVGCIFNTVFPYAKRVEPRTWRPMRLRNQ
jgi:hypothetical protein